MAQTDQYDRMNSDQLQAEAEARGLDLDEFQSLANNRERAQALRDHDAARDADAEIAQRNAEQVRQQQQGQPAEAGQPTEQPQAQTGSGQPTDTDPAPYSSDDSLHAAQAAASGDLRTDESIDPADAGPVGGDSAYIDPDPESR